MNNSAIGPIGQDHPAHRYLVAHLALRMSDISEDLWCAGWLMDLEFRLWEAIQGGTSDPFAEEDLRELAELSALVGGWHNGERFIPIDEWHSILSEHRRTSTDRQD
jgi:hypothetical protein